MFSDDEIISIREVCLTDKCDRKDSTFNNPLLLSDSAKNESEIDRSQRTSDGFYPDNEQQQASFAWTEADGSLASLVLEPNFCQDLDLELDPEIKTELKEPDTSHSSCSSSSCRSAINFTRKTPQFSSDYVSSTSASSTSDFKAERTRVACRIDKADPRSRLHFVKYLKRHGRTVKLWECGICSREFQHQYTLVRHLPTHTDERNFHCDSCGKSFRQLSTLSQHRAIHSTERPYECEVCTKTFNRVSTLISHRKTHSGNKPYKCHICPKGFHQKGNLRNHLFTHTNERPYRCNICYKGFNQQSNLVCHKNKAHPDDNKYDMSRNRNSTHTSTSPGSEIKGYPVENCEVSSSVGPNLPPTSTIPWTTNLESVWELPGTSNLDWTLTGQEWPLCSIPSGETDNGVVMDPVTTYHMGLAMASRQTPFALLKSETGDPILVKMIDAILPGGKQVLVPATTEALKAKGKFIQNSEFIKALPKVVSTSNIHENIAMPASNHANNNGEIITSVDANVANLCNNTMSVRAPVATTLPQENRGSRLSTAFGELPRRRNLGSCGDHNRIPVPPPLMRALPLTNQRRSHDLRDGLCPVPLTPPSPPSLNLIHGMDLFETMDCMPLDRGFDLEKQYHSLTVKDSIARKSTQFDVGPQIVAVDNVEQPALSDDSDVFIGEFEESIPLSDSD